MALVQFRLRFEKVQKMKVAELCNRNGYSHQLSPVHTHTHTHTHTQPTGTVLAGMCKRYIVKQSNLMSRKKENRNNAEKEENKKNKSEKEEQTKKQAENGQENKETRRKRTTRNGIKYNDRGEEAGY